MTHTSNSSVDRGGRGHAFVFVLEQVLGHAVHGRNIQRALDDETDISPTVIPVGQRRAGLASRLPLLGSWSFEASMAARAGLRSRLSAGHADAVFIHTQVATLLAGDLMRRVPTVISLDATPVNFDSLGAGYGHGRQPEAVERWIRYYESEREAGEEFNAFVDRTGTAGFEERVKDLSMPVEFSLENLQHFIDWSRSEPYQVIRGEGECAV